MNNKPFQQFSPDVPPGATIGQKWFRRHIIVDHPGRNIYIQVLQDYSGELSFKEFSEIKAGLWYDYVPASMVDHIRQGIGSGYKIKPLGLAGSQVGEEHVIFQLLDITNDRNLMRDSTITQPIFEQNQT